MASEGGMDTYTQRMKVLTDLPEAWQSGSQATVCNLESLAVLSSDHGAPASTSKIETDEMPSIQPSYSNVVVATAKPTVLSSDHGAPASTSKIESDEMSSIQPSHSNVVVATAKPEVTPTPIIVPNGSILKYYHNDDNTVTITFNPDQNENVPMAQDDVVQIPATPKETKIRLKLKKRKGLDQQTTAWFAMKTTTWTVGPDAIRAMPGTTRDAQVISR